MGSWVLNVFLYIFLDCLIGNRKQYHPKFFYSYRFHPHCRTQWSQWSNVWKHDDLSTFEVEPLSGPEFGNTLVSLRSVRVPQERGRQPPPFHHLTVSKAVYLCHHHPYRWRDTFAIIHYIDLYRWFVSFDHPAFFGGNSMRMYPSWTRGISSVSSETSPFRSSWSLKTRRKFRGPWIQDSQRIHGMGRFTPSL